MPSTHFSSGGMRLPDRSVPASEGATRQDEGRPRALVVDDAPDVTEMIAMFLQHAGYDAVMTFSAAEALEAARTEQFEVIVSDIGMPGMNGYDLAVALRALPGYQTVPLIAVTGFSMYDDRGRALASGFNAHMTKPINPMSLLDLIKSLRD
jgi:two-component system, chemotaxis family, CheB/CheR fusion protein